MNNLKRVLSLGLASISLIGTMAVGASAADFSDRNTIEHKEAVDVLAALNVINGKSDGTFAPGEKVTRGQMAKMLYIAYTGSDVDPGMPSKPKFTDSNADGWSGGYVEACAVFGIISGRGDGTFDPNGVVTTTEVAKMVLVALGYEPNAHGLLGAEWDTHTQQYARQAKPQLFDGLSKGVVLDAPATRDVAAQIIWNGLQNTVKVPQNSRDYNTVEKGYTVTYVDGKETLLTQTFKAHVAQGTFAGNYYFNKGSAEKKSDLYITSATSKDTTKLWSDTYNFSVRFTDEQIKQGMMPDIANIGEQVRVIWKDADTEPNMSSQTDKRPDKFDYLYGVFLTGATQGTKTTMDKVEDNKNNDKTIKISGETYELADKVTVWTNFRTSKVFENEKLMGGTGVNSALTEYLKHKEGSTLKTVKDPASGKITTIYLTRSEIAKVNSVDPSTNKINLNNNFGEVSMADNDVEEGLQRGDVVVVTLLYQDDASNKDAFVTVKKAEKVSGKVTATDGKKSITLGDKSYKIMDTTDAQKGEDLKTIGLTDAMTSLTSDNHGDNFDLYLVDGYVRAAVQDTASSSNYAVITEVQNGKAGATLVSQRLEVVVLTASGTKETLVISDKSAFVETGSELTDVKDDHKVLNSEDSIGAIITYSKDSDGKTKIKTYEPMDQTGTVQYKSGEKTFADIETTTNAVLFHTDENNKWQAKKLQSTISKTYMDKPYVMVENSDGKIVAVAVDYQGAVGGDTSNSVYGIVSATKGTTTISNTVYNIYTVLAGGETYTVNCEKTLKKGDIVNFAPQSDKTYDSDEVKVLSQTGDKDVSNSYTIFVGYVKGYSEGETVRVASDVKFDGEHYVVTGYERTYLIASDTKIFGVGYDRANDTYKSAAQPGLSEFNDSRPYTNIIVVADVPDGNNQCTAKALIVNVSTDSNIVADDVTVQMTIGSNKPYTLNRGTNDAYEGYKAGTAVSFAIQGDDISDVKLNNVSYTSGDSTSLTSGANTYTLSFTQDGNEYIYKVTINATAK